MGRIYYFHAGAVDTILRAARDGKPDVAVSLDLNLSVGTWAIRDHCLVLADNTVIALQDLVPMASAGNKVFGFDGRDLLPIEVRADGYYKLVPTASAPTLEINGIKMHRSKDIDPLDDARLKAELVVRTGDHVLDTCGGLGYSALFAVKAGAAQVVSTEKSRQVIRIREQNPWLAPGARDWQTLSVMKRIQLANADITGHITTLADKAFDAVIHDPPRFCSATGDLYGKAFYTELARVMPTGARLFHYTGSPKKITHGDRFIRNAVKRLEQAGFKKAGFNERLQGIYAERAGQAFP
ncbi:MAG: hypothetical protein V6Z89_08315 [Desulfobacter sp.]